MATGQRKAAAVIGLLERTILKPQKTFEREALLKRHREIQAELAQIERNLREGDAPAAG